VFPKLLYCDLRCSQTGLRCPQVGRHRSWVCRWCSQVLLALLPVLPVTLKAGWNFFQRFDNLLKLTFLSSHSTSPLTLLESSSDKNTSCRRNWFIGSLTTERIYKNLPLLDLHLLGLGRMGLVTYVLSGMGYSLFTIWRNSSDADYSIFACNTAYMN
jgi:hypothetical protein